MTVGEFVGLPWWGMALATLCGVRLEKEDAVKSDVEKLDEWCRGLRPGDLVRLRAFADGGSRKVLLVEDCPSSTGVKVRGASVPWSVGSVEPVGSIRVGDRVRITESHTGLTCSIFVGQVAAIESSLEASLREGEFKIQGLVHPRRGFDVVAHDEPLGPKSAPTYAEFAPMGTGPVTRDHHELVCKTWQGRAEAAEAECDLALKDAAKLQARLDASDRVDADQVDQILSHMLEKCPYPQEGRNLAEWAVFWMSLLAKSCKDRSAELALEREHVLRLKLALSEALPKRPPASLLERAATRVGVEARAFARTSLLAFARTSLFRVVPVVVLLLVMHSALRKTEAPSVMTRPPLLDAPPVYAPLTPASSCSSFGTAAIVTSAPWAWSMEYEGSRLPCPRCGEVVEGDTLLTFRKGGWRGPVAFRGCFPCMIRDLGTVDRLRPAPGGGITLETYAVKAGTVFVVDGPVQGVALVSSGDSSVMVKRGGR